MLAQRGGSDPAQAGPPLPGIEASEAGPVTSYVEVLPNDGSESVAGHTANYVDFEIWLDSIGNYDIDCVLTGSLSNCHTEPEAIEFWFPTFEEPAGIVRANFHSGPSGSGTIKLRLTRTGCSAPCADADSGSFSITVGAVNEATMVPQSPDRPACSPRPSTGTKTRRSSTTMARAGSSPSPIPRAWSRPSPTPPWTPPTS